MAKAEPFANSRKDDRRRFVRRVKKPARNGAEIRAGTWAEVGAGNLSSLRVFWRSARRCQVF